MIHIIWSGRGFLVAVFVFGSSWIANLVTNSVTGSGAYWDEHKWPFAASLIVSATACWYFGRSLHSRKRMLVDPGTGEQVVLRESHTLFFVPMLWWGPILVCIGVVMLVVELAR